jgi:hypothetical protein
MGIWSGWRGSPRPLGRCPAALAVDVRIETIMNDEAKQHRQTAADHFRRARKATTASEKASETRAAKSYKSMADNQEWLDRVRAKVAERKLGPE